MRVTTEPPAGEPEPIVAARRRSGLLAGAAAACLAGFAATYFLFVWTRPGQAFEFHVLQGIPALSDTPPVLRARAWLGYVTEYAMAAVVAVIVVIGLVRRRPALAIAGAVTVCATALLDRVLVRWVLTRPELVPDPMNAENSFPSGHVAMSASALLGLLIVVPVAWRGCTALLGSALVVGVAEMTMTVGWHRLSDTIGGNLLALGIACVAVAVPVRLGGVRTPPLRWPPLARLVAIVPLLGYVAWTVVSAAGPAYDVLTNGAAADPPRTFEAAGAAATVVSALTVVAFLGLLARAEPAPRTRTL
ncbi:phosphatase PAP2 family protein [Amycolatopsis minnesotensis]|uniref:Phosphatase PAP2 family protein n=1 Tax=Amycolatopsis minnesotensis TaxID=337894 RepID=A0ABP5BMV0_9PSEU